MENFILRLRGVKFGDIQKVREGKIRLREIRFMPRAELIPMRGIRPEGLETEEAHEECGGPNGEARQEQAQEDEGRQGRPEGAEQEETEQRSEREASFKFNICVPQWMRGDR